MNQGFAEVQQLGGFHHYGQLMAALLYHPVSLKAAGLLFMPSLPTCLAGRNKDCFFPTAGFEGDCRGLQHWQKLVEDQGLTLKPYGKYG